MPAENAESNRERIFAAALKLFSQRGYENVSVRDIAHTVGIRASSIYNHFRSKEAILDEVVTDFRRRLRERRINDPWPNLDEAVERHGPKSILVKIMTAPVELLEDDELIDHVRVVTRGQYFHAGTRDFLYEEFFLRPGVLLAGVLHKFRNLGLVRDWPPEFLVAELQAPIIATFYRRSLHPDGSSVDSAQTLAAVERHVAFFWKAAAGGAGGEENYG